MEDSRIKEFLAHFDGDVNAAHATLNEYALRLSPHVSGSRPINPQETIISAENISKEYRLGKQTVHALHGATLTVGKGEFIAVTGPSGSGKSTLLQLIGCLDRPTSGEIMIENKATARLNDSALSELRQNAIGFVFQSFYLQPFLRLHDNIAVPAMFTDEKRNNIDDNVNRLLKQVGLFERANHFPKELSGGQIQRAAIARALINKPRIILADEPTGNLDVRNSQIIIDLFRTIRDKTGTTVIVVTHDDVIARQADRVIRLVDGVTV